MSIDKSPKCPISAPLVWWGEWRASRNCLLVKQEQAAQSEGNLGGTQWGTEVALAMRTLWLTQTMKRKLKKGKIGNIKLITGE